MSCQSWGVWPTRCGPHTMWAAGWQGCTALQWADRKIKRLKHSFILNVSAPSQDLKPPPVPVSLGVRVVVRTNRTLIVTHSILVVISFMHGGRIIPLPLPFPLPLPPPLSPGGQGGAEAANRQLPLRSILRGLCREGVPCHRVWTTCDWLP